MKKNILLLAVLTLSLTSCEDIFANSSTSPNSSTITDSTTSEDTGNSSSQLPDSSSTPDSSSSSEDNTSSSSEELPEETYQNLSKKGTLSLDANINILGMVTLNSSIKAPSYVNYTAGDDSLMEIGQENEHLNLEILTNLKEGVASEGVTADEQAYKNLKALKDVTNLQDILSTVSSLLPSDLLPSLPGQYKALGYGMKQVVSGLESETNVPLTGEELTTALASTNDEYLSLYLSNGYIGFGEYSVKDNVKQARAFVENEYTYNPIDISTYLEPIMNIIAQVGNMSLEEIQKIDFISLISSMLADGTYPGDAINSMLIEKWNTIRSILNVLIGGVDVTKYTSEDGNEVSFTIGLNEHGLTELRTVLIDLLNATGQVPSVASAFLDTFLLKDFSFGFSVYEDNQYLMHFKDISFDLGFEFVNVANSLSFSFEVDDESTTTLSDDYFEKAKVDYDRFEKASDSFNEFYAKAGSAIKYFTGDAPYNRLDLSNANEAAIKAVAEQYDSLSDDTKFMLTDAVSKKAILDYVEAGKTTLNKAITNFKAIENPTMASIKSAFGAVSSYKNFTSILKETDEETYNKILAIEEAEISSLEEKMETAVTHLNSATNETTDADLNTYFKEVATLRSSLNNYIPTSFFGITSPATYDDTLFLTNDLINRKNALIVTEESEATNNIYNLEKLASSVYGQRFVDIVGDNVSGSEEETLARFYNFYTANHTNVIRSSSLQSMSKEVLTSYTSDLDWDYTDITAIIIEDQLDKLLEAYANLRTNMNSEAKTAWETASKNYATIKRYLGCEYDVFGKTVSNDDTTDDIRLKGDTLAKNVA